MDKQLKTLIENIQTTENVEKLEVTISMLMFGWVMDDHNKSEYEHLIELSQHRLRILMIIKGDHHPLCDLDLKKDKKKIEMSVMMSMMKSVMEEEKFDPFSTMNMN